MILYNLLYDLSPAFKFTLGSATNLPILLFTVLRLSGTHEAHGEWDVGAAFMLFAKDNNNLGMKQRTKNTAKREKQNPAWVQTTA